MSFFARVNGSLGRDTNGNVIDTVKDKPTGGSGGSGFAKSFKSTFSMGGSSSSSSNKGGVNNIVKREADDKQRLAPGHSTETDNWQNRDHAQFHPAITTPLLDQPHLHSPPTTFVHNPHYYVNDASNPDEQTLVESNGGRWWQVCFPGDVPSDQEAPQVRSYHSPFPGQSSALSVTDLHVHDATHTVKLRFTLPLGVDEAGRARQLKHTEFVAKYGNVNSDTRGLVKIPISQALLRKHLEKELKDIDWDNTPYHLNVYDITTTFESSNFLVQFDKILTSSSAMSEMLQNSWSVPRGIDNSADNLVMVRLLGRLLDRWVGRLLDRWVGRWVC
jgi:hypothetical protein